jgi:hypothetical protein
MLCIRLRIPLPQNGGEGKGEGEILNQRKVFKTLSFLIFDLSVLVVKKSDPSTSLGMTIKTKA